MVKQKLTKKDRERIDYLKSEIIANRSNGWNRKGFKEELIDGYGFSKKYVESL